MRRLLALAVLSALALSGCGEGASSPLGGGGDSKLQKAYDFCASEDSGLDELASMDELDPATKQEMLDPISVEDGGDSIIISDDKAIYGTLCILGKLGISDALLNDIDSTTAMMGRQHASEKGYDLSWSYHPDNGMNMTIKKD